MSKVDPQIRLTADNNGETKCVISTYNETDARKILEQHTSRIVGCYPFINSFGVFVNVHKLEDLESLPCVRAVTSHSTVLTMGELGSYEKRQIAYVENGENDSEKKQTTQESKDRLKEYLKIEELEEIQHNNINSNLLAKVHCAWDNGYYGQNIGVAVIDTGTMPHLDFMIPRYRVSVYKDFTTDNIQMYDDNGHGTAVAGIVCGNGLLSNGQYVGVAPKANLISLKAINNSGEGSAFAILEAMQWIHTNKTKYNIKVLCLSFGAEPKKNDPLKLGAEALWRSGVTVVASAGNSGPSYNTIRSPGISPVIITAGAVNLDLSVPDYSSRGPCEGFHKPDVMACGETIAPSYNGYAAYVGTSMAAPIVAGLCALILNKYPNYTPDKVKEALINNAYKLKHELDICGYGLANVDFLKE